MTQFLVLMTRAFKKLIYLVFLWTAVCFLVFHLTTNLLNNGSEDYVDNHLSHFKYVPPKMPKIDNSPPLSEEEVLAQLANKSNLPLTYWAKLKKSGKLYKNEVLNIGPNKSCKVKFPNIYELNYNNIYWQRLDTPNGKFYLFNAYFDDRSKGGPLPMVRILAMVDRVSPPQTYCQLWFDMLSPIVVPATYIYGWNSYWGNYKDGFLQPFIVTCTIPKIKGFIKGLCPESVSLVYDECSKASNSLRVYNIRPKIKEDFAVCVKGLDFLYDDRSVRLVEWLELLKILGAKKVFIYVLEAHPNITKVLNYYQEQGFVDTKTITLPGDQPNIPGFRHLYLKNKMNNKRQNELIAYNDCLYRNLYSYQYLALLDIDEIIIPKNLQNWSQLMDKVQNMSLVKKNQDYASYNARNVYFLDNLREEKIMNRLIEHEPGIPRYLHMLQHVHRLKNYTRAGFYVKCFHNTERVVSLHNHFPLKCFGYCTSYSISTELAHLQHYKDCNRFLKNNCKDFVANTTRDTTIFKYKKELINTTTDVLNKLGFF